MGLRRYFPRLYVVVDKRKPRVKEWFSIDLARHKLFNDDYTSAQATDDEPQEGGKFADADDKKLKMTMETMPRATLLPSEEFGFLASNISLRSNNRKNWYVDFFPLPGRRVLFAVDCGRTMLISRGGYVKDGYYRRVTALKTFDMPNRSPFAVLVPRRLPPSTPERTFFGDEAIIGIQAILVMERSPVLEPVPAPPETFSSWLMKCSRKKELLECHEVRDGSTIVRCHELSDGSTRTKVTRLKVGDGRAIARKPIRESHHQFLAIVYCSESRSWTHVPFPAPPFMYDPKYYVEGRCPSISSYAVVPGPYFRPLIIDSHVVCISVDGAGTYCFDTGSRDWTKVGDWNLPFIGRAEYVEELKLWVGICPTTKGKGKEFQLGAADLSSMGTGELPQRLPQPQLVGTWKELTDDTTEGWKEVRCPQLVNLGSGRFCIARFFSDRHSRPVWKTEEPTRLTFDKDKVGRKKLFTTVLTGVEVELQKQHTSTDDDKDNLQLQMITHNSFRHEPDATDGSIQLVF